MALMEHATPPMDNKITSPADRLRTAFQHAGFSARQVTVRQRHNTLHVTIRCPSVSLTRVTEIAGGWEVVRRDHATQEILCGGNTFVDVQYVSTLVAPIKSAILAVLESAPDDQPIALPGDYRAIKVSRAGGATYHGEVRIWGRAFDYRNNIAVGLAFAAQRIAIASLDASACSTEEAA